MIIHTRKYKVADLGHRQAAKESSKQHKKTTADRRAFLATVRTRESANKEQAIKRIPYNRLTEFFGVAGVYFLIHEERVVYVGESACIITRLGQHMQDKVFDGFRVISEQDPANRLKLEKAYIQKYSPIYNITHNPSLTTRKPIVRLREDLSQIDL